MFDTQTLPASPELARRLLAFSQMNGLVFDEKLADLASQDLLDIRDLADKPWKFDPLMVNALQHVQDWRGRAMLLESGNDRSRVVALANAALRGGKTLILAQPTFYSQWAELVRKAWPDAKISIFGNPRYAPKDATYPEGLDFCDRPDLDADFLITSYGGVIWHDLIERLDANQTIVEELDHVGSINYKWKDAVDGLFHEMPAPLFIQNIHNLPNDTGRDNMASLQISGSKAIQYLGQIVHGLMWAGLSVTRPLVAGSMRDVEGYLTEKAYEGADMLGILNIMGVSSHLISTNESKTNLVFFDDTISNLRIDVLNRKESGLNRMVEREEDLERTSDLSISQLVWHALNGDSVKQELIGGLRTNQWANLKSQHLKTIHTNLTNKMSHSLFLVENQDLKRNLRLQLGPLIEDYSTAPDLSYLVARYHYPNHSTYGMSMIQMTNIRRLGNMIVTLDDLIEQPSLLESSNFLFLPEWPLDRDVYEAIKAAAEASGTRLVTSVLNGTFEQIIHAQLQ